MFITVTDWASVAKTCRLLSHFHLILYRPKLCRGRNIAGIDMSRRHEHFRGVCFASSPPTCLRRPPPLCTRPLSLQTGLWSPPAAGAEAPADDRLPHPAALAPKTSGLHKPSFSSPGDTLCPATCLPVCPPAWLCCSCGRFKALSVLLHSCQYVDLGRLSEKRLFAHTRP